MCEDERILGPWNMAQLCMLEKSARDLGNLAEANRLRVRIERQIELRKKASAAPAPGRVL